MRVHLNEGIAQATGRYLTTKQDISNAIRAVIIFRARGKFSLALLLFSIKLLEF